MCSPKHNIIHYNYIDTYTYKGATIRMLLCEWEQKFQPYLPNNFHTSKKSIVGGCSHCMIFSFRRISNLKYWDTGDKPWNSIYYLFTHDNNS
jgi:hypothetical protein